MSNGMGARVSLRTRTRVDTSQRVAPVSASRDGIFEGIWFKRTTSLYVCYFVVHLRRKSALAGWSPVETIGRAGGTSIGLDRRENARKTRQLQTGTYMFCDIASGKHVSVAGYSNTNSFKLRTKKGGHLTSPRLTSPHLNPNNPSRQPVRMWTHNICI